MGSFVESALGQHCKSTKITPAATSAGEAERSCVNAPCDQRAKASFSVSPLSSSPHAFVDLRVVCGDSGNFLAQRWRTGPTHRWRDCRHDDGIWNTRGIAGTRDRTARALQHSQICSTMPRARGLHA
jgi:hypothetical protein